MSVEDTILRANKQMDALWEDYQTSAPLHPKYPNEAWLQSPKWKRHDTLEDLNDEAIYLVISKIHPSSWYVGQYYEGFAGVKHGAGSSKCNHRWTYFSNIIRRVNRGSGNYHWTYDRLIPTHSGQTPGAAAGGWGVGYVFYEYVMTDAPKYFINWIDENPLEVKE